jgi:arabinofuranan 3-O-arabinosyltransferase
LAVIAYVPLLFTHPGMVGADTKQYLYLDPSRMLAHAPSMWDPTVGMGTVTHQNIGYLLPMGPWYWTLHLLRVPTWVAQRLWIGTLLFLAGLGVVFLLRTLGWEGVRPGHLDEPAAAGPARRDGYGPAVLVAALAFMLSPYVLEYEARISAILMPWAALPWMVALVIRALRAGGWRYPAWFALTVALVGGVNATSLIYAGIAPVLWFPFAVWVIREVTLRRAAGTLARIGFLTVLGSLWWMAGLLTQAGYGLDVLRYTETVQVVAQTGLPIEVLRGLGNWYFYGRDSIGPWVQPAAEYTQQLWRLGISYLLPVLAFLAGVAARWRYKLYFVTLVIVGTAIAVGVHPYNHPSPLGASFKTFANSSSAGLALRSVGRAVPLVALGMAVLLGSGIEALGARLARQPVPASTRLARLVARPGLPRLAFVAVGALVVANMAPLFTGQFVDNNLQRPNDIPAYWKQAAATLDARGSSTRVLELPGADFSHYRWGTTLDPLLPGLMNRPYVGRELIPFGSPASADLLRALDERLQEGVFEPQSLAPLARLMNVGDVVLRSDLQYERFTTPRPRPTWQLFDPSPAGLSAPLTLGPPVPSNPVVPLLDEISLATPPSAPDPPAVAIYGVNGSVPIVHTEGDGRPIVVAGDGAGLVDLAAAGLLDGRSQASGPVLYSAALAKDPATLQGALAAGADLVLTDTNRRQGQRWGTIRGNVGYTEAAGEQPLVKDPTDNRLPLFPNATDDSYTVAEQRGVKAVRATAFGNPVSYAPGERPDLALDGDPGTAWKTGAFSDVVGDRLRIDLLHPVTTDHVNLVQPLVGARERYITRATVTFDGGSPVTVDLNGASRTLAGQDVTFPSRTFTRLDITVDTMNFGRRADYRGGSPVGFAEVRIPGVQVDEVLRLPVDLLNAAGTGSLDHRLVVELTRERANPLESFTTDGELSIVRTFDLPTARTFSFEGTARLSSAPGNDDAVDGDLGRPTPAQGGLVVRASDRLPGDLHSRAEAAVDGNLSTAWTTPFGDPEGNWISVTAPHAVAFDHLDLAVIADGRHSVPTELRISVAGRPDQDVAVPAVADSRTENATTTVRIPLKPVSGTSVKITILATRREKTINYLSAIPQTLPVGIAELGIAGLTQPLQGGNLPGICRTDLLTVDGRPVGVHVQGTRAAALDTQPLTVSLCGGPLTLGPGSHDVRARPGRDSGINIDRIVLGSERGGGALDLGPGGPTLGQGGTDAAPANPAPSVQVLRSGTTSMTVKVDAPDHPFWLVLGQSNNAGWTARTVGDGGRDLGHPVLVDGYANGWLVKPAASGAMTIHLDWTPQHRVVVALWLSALALLASLAVALVPTRRTWRRFAAPDSVQRMSNLPTTPIPASPFRADGRQVSRRSGVVVVVAGLVAAAAVIGPVPGAIVGAALAAVVIRPRLRPILSAGAVALLALSALYVVQLQLRYHFPTKIEWPSHFDKVALIPWIAAAFLLGDVVLEHLRSHWTAPRE